MTNQNPVALFELDDTDKLLVLGTPNMPVIDLYDGVPTKKGTITTVVAFRDCKGRKVGAMIEQVDGDRVCLISLEATRRFMIQHVMVEVDDEVTEQLRGGAAAD